MDFVKNGLGWDNGNLPYCDGFCKERVRLGLIIYPIVMDFVKNGLGWDNGNLPYCDGFLRDLCFASAHFKTFLRDKFF